MSEMVKKELIWILEHPTTYTGGVRYNKEEILDKKFQLLRQIEVEN